MMRILIFQPMKCHKKEDMVVQQMSLGRVGVQMVLWG